MRVLTIAIAVIAAVAAQRGAVRDPEYMRELRRRDAIQGGANTAELERLARTASR